MVLRHVLVVIATTVVVLFPGQPVAAAPAQVAGESVAMLQKAIETRDMALVAQYLDIDTVLEKGVHSITLDEDILREASKYPALSMALALGPNVGSEILRNILAAEAREFIRHGIVSGAFAGEPVPNASVYGGIFSKAFRGGDRDKLSFGKATVTKAVGDTAYISTTLVEGRKNTTYPLELLARREKGVWRIVEVTNAAQFFGGGKGE